MNIYAKPIEKDNSVVMATGKGVGDWVQVGKGRKNGGICYSVNNQKKVKK